MGVKLNEKGVCWVCDRHPIPTLVTESRGGSCCEPICYFEICQDCVSRLMEGV
jgi:hypothetical protein